MYKEFCVTCSQDIPICAAQEIICKTSLENIISGTIVNRIPFPVCHNNAIHIKGNKVLIDNDNCDECGLCVFLCHKAFDVIVHTPIFKDIIFDDIERMAMFLQKVLKDVFVASEIFASGVSRKKRIDIVLKKQDAIYIIKVLKDDKKMHFYKRSYDAIKSMYSGVNIKVIILLPILKPDSNESCYDLHGLIQLVGTK